MKQRTAMQEWRRNGGALRIAAPTLPGVAVALMAVLGVLGASGCGSTPPPPPPRVEIATSLDYYPGSPLGGSRGTMPELIDPAKALALRVDIFGLEAEIDLGTAPLAERLYLVTAVPSGDPVLPVSSLLAGARLASGRPAGAMRERLLSGGLPGVHRVATHRGVAISEVTTQIDVRGRRASMMGADGRTAADSIELHIFECEDAERLAARGAGALEVALVTETIAVDDRPDDSPAFTREAGLIDVGVAVDEPLALYVPSLIRDSGYLGFVLFVTVDSPLKRDPIVQNMLVDACMRALEARIRRDAEPVPPVLGHVGDGDIRLALEALDDPQHQRRALIYMTRALEADLALEIAFLAEEDVVGDLAAAVRKRVGSVGVPSPEGGVSAAGGPPADLDWILQQEAAGVLVRYLQNHREATSLAGLAVRYAGEIGWRPELLRVISADAKSRAGFLAELTEANRSFLDDASPGARIRAFDWLSRRGIAPVGYDPLGPGVERRAALLRDEEKTATEAASGAEGESKAKEDQR